MIIDEGFLSNAKKISAEYPVLYEGHYTYMTFSFEYDNRKNPDEYNHMKDMTDRFKFNYHMELTSEILINVVDKDGNIK